MTFSYAAPGRWVSRAACSDHQDMMLMPLVGKPGSYTNVEFQRVQAGIAMCKTCPVLDECRAWALTEPDPAVGLIAGGLSPNQRRDIRMGREPRTLRTPGRPGSAGRNRGTAA